MLQYKETNYNFFGIFLDDDTDHQIILGATTLMTLSALLLQSLPDDDYQSIQCIMQNTPTDITAKVKGQAGGELEVAPWNELDGLQIGQWKISTINADTLYDIFYVNLPDAETPDTSL